MSEPLMVTWWVWPASVDEVTVTSSGDTDSFEHANATPPPAREQNHNGDQGKSDGRLVEHGSVLLSIRFPATRYRPCRETLQRGQPMNMTAKKACRITEGHRMAYR